MLGLTTKKDQSSLMVSTSRGKYGGINLSSFARFGSLEIRLFRGITESKEFMPFVLLVDSILQYARKGGTPNELFNQYMSNKEEMLADILGSNPLLEGVNLIELADKNLWYFSELCFAKDSWSGLLTNKKKADPEITQDVIDEMCDRLGFRDFTYLSSAEQRFVIQQIRNGVDAPVPPVPTRSFTDEFATITSQEEDF